MAQSRAEGLGELGCQCEDGGWRGGWSSGGRACGPWMLDGDGELALMETITRCRVAVREKISHALANSAQTAIFYRRIQGVNPKLLDNLRMIIRAPRSEENRTKKYNRFKYLLLFLVKVIF